MVSTNLSPSTTYYYQVRAANASGSSTSSSTITLTTPSLPVITGFNPTSGSIGTSVALTGTGFDPVPANNIVKFNGIAAIVTAGTATSITTSVPASATTGTITVTVAGQTGTSSTSFTVIRAPTITSFSPTSGGVGTSVTITGTGFDTTPANNTVKFNGSVATVTASSATSITATVLTGTTTGTITVTVAGQTGTSSTNFTFVPPPVITSFSPTSAGFGATVTITGTGFDTTPGNNIVKFNGIQATITGTPTATSISVLVPAGAVTGSITVVVGGQTAASPTNFTLVLPPAITGFNPDHGGVGTTVTLTGTGFDTTPANNIVKFNGAPATVLSLPPPTATSITVLAPASFTTGPITITVGTQTGTSVGNFTLWPPPTITDASVKSGKVNDIVTIIGTNFDPTLAMVVRFNNSVATITGTPTATSIATSVPAGATKGPISVKVGTQTATSTFDFTILSGLTITNEAFPTTFDKGGKLTVSISADQTKVSVVNLKSRGISEEVTALKTTIVTGASNKFEKISPTMPE